VVGAAVQLRQRLPRTPHCASFGCIKMQRDGSTPDWQQPPTHKPGSQLHMPALQASPCGQAAPPPQVQVPLKHPSAPGPQLTHTAPLVPQAEGLNAGSHTPFLQQPFGQVAALHPLQTPPSQAHVWHATPPVPQAESSWPPWHCWPVPQQPLHDMPSQTQVPPLHHCPPPHTGSPPQVHFPFEQVSALGGLIPRVQSAHAAPMVPHAVTSWSDAGTHWVSRQQPPRAPHSVTSHPHVPPTPAPQR
jgi:hypothetical protein